MGWGRGHDLAFFGGVPSGFTAGASATGRDRYGAFGSPVNVGFAGKGKGSGAAAAAPRTIVPGTSLGFDPNFSLQ
jgi:hypothetical protein